jgi:prepilin-type N-terminal cleavage/methylation domain-containing protein
MNHRHRIQSRAGFTVIEMLAAMILLSSLVSMLCVLLRWSTVGYSNTLRHIVEIQSSERWSERLRQEIHSAEHAEIASDDFGIQLFLSGQEIIQYAQEDGSIMRKRLIADRLLSSEQAPWRFPVRFSKNSNFKILLISATFEDGSRVEARMAVALAEEPHAQ